MINGGYSESDVISSHEKNMTLLTWDLMSHLNWLCILLFGVRVPMHVCRSTHATAHAWSAGSSFRELVFFLLPCDLARTIKLGEASLPAKSPCWPRDFSWRSSLSSRLPFRTVFHSSSWAGHVLYFVFHLQPWLSPMGYLASLFLHLISNMSSSGAYESKATKHFCVTEMYHHKLKTMAMGQEVPTVSSISHLFFLKLRVSERSLLHIRRPLFLYRLEWLLTKDAGIGGNYILNSRLFV